MRPRILLVDSEIVSRQKISRFLSSGGYSVTEAGSGRTALNLLHTSTFELIVSDSRLMDGTEGVEVLACAEGLQPGLIALLLGRPNDLQHCNAIDAAFVSKPVRLEELRLKIALLLIHRTRFPELVPTTRMMIANIRSQRATSVILGHRFQELRVRREESFSQNVRLRERALELKDQLRYMIPSSKTVSD